MNIKLIKAEIEKLSLLLAKWDEQQEVSAIERDIALDKLKSIYNEVQFATPAVVQATTPSEPDPTEEEMEPQVEVELLFADDELEYLQEEHNAAESLSGLVAATVSAAMAETTTEAKEAEEETDEEAEAEAEAEAEEEAEAEAEEEAEAKEIVVPFVVEEVATEQPVAEESAAEEPAAETPAVESAEPTDTPDKSAAPAEQESAHKATQPMDNLFGLEKVRRQPRSKHQRMMSIYNDVEPRQEKVVDISKIFDVNIDEPQSFEPTRESAAHHPTTPVATTIAQSEEKPATLGEAIAATPTLADTLEAATPLAEEINHTNIQSLRDGIGLNDKFLMIRDLFDGDDVAYEQAISALDEQQTLDDCMIYIIENYAWNPDSEGSKFIMQLLERKLL